ncbi:MAG: hypothetical protein KF757_05105 [Phycisphaeraceae bacterium]|nr:hypothetical protein [Phycisphaeraceae bacterium]MCW5763854.1 hypothetical protein [Phycisphaeraceae bacterium]
MDLDAGYFSGVTLTNRQFIHAWAEQLGSAHDDANQDMGLANLLDCGGIRVELFGLSLQATIFRQICRILLEPTKVLLAEFDNTPDLRLVIEHDIQVCRDNMGVLPIADRRHLGYARHMLLLISSTFPNLLLKNAIQMRRQYLNDPIVMLMQAAALSQRDTDLTTAEAEHILRKALGFAKNDPDVIKYCAMELACVLCKRSRLPEAAEMLILSIEAGGYDMIESQQELQPLRESAHWERVIKTTPQPAKFSNKISSVSFGPVGSYRRGGTGHGG